jgi:putative membrane protein
MLLEQLAKIFDAAPAFTGPGLLVPMSQLTDYILSTLIFVAIGLVFFALAFLIIVKTTPFSIRKELEEDHNTALAIVIGSVIIGIALIVSAAIHG